MKNIPIGKLDDHGILMKFQKMTGKVRPIFQSENQMTMEFLWNSKWMGNIRIRKLDDHGILTKFYKDN